MKVTKIELEGDRPGARLTLQASSARGLKGASESEVRLTLTFEGAPKLNDLLTVDGENPDYEKVADVYRRLNGYRGTNSDVNELFQLIGRIS